MNSKHVKIGVMGSLFLGFMLGSAIVAHATAGASSSASLDWSAVSISGDAGMTVTDTSRYSESVSMTNSPWLQQIDPPSTSFTWGDTAVFLPPNGSGNNLAVASAATYIDSLDAQSIALADGAGEFSAQASTQRLGLFTVSGSGNVTISIPYLINLLLFLDNPANESARGTAEVGLYLENSTTGQFDSFFDVFTELSLPPTDASGTLSLSIPFSNGDSGMFYVWTNTDATASSVPEPSTLALLGIGLVGVTVVRKRNRK